MNKDAGQQLLRGSLPPMPGAPRLTATSDSGPLPRVWEGIGASWLGPLPCWPLPTPLAPNKRETCPEPEIVPSLPRSPGGASMTASPLGGQAVSCVLKSLSQQPGGWSVFVLILQMSKSRSCTLRDPARDIQGVRGWLGPQQWDLAPDLVAPSLPPPWPLSMD